MTPVEQITSLYIGYFGRAPDPVGLNYWVGRLNDGFSLAEIAESFSVQAESQAKYPYLANPNIASPQAFITQVYLNLFNRTPDAEGLAYWTAQLNNGTDIGDFILDVISGAVNNPSDQAIIDNKVEAGVYFAREAADLPGFVYNDEAAAAAVEVINGVDGTAASVEAANAETDAFIGGGVTGDEFTLTSGLDQFVGTGGNDTFQGVEADLNGFDDLKGGAGNDTLDLYVDGGLAIAPTVSISNIETINLIRTASVGTVDASVFEGAEAIWQINNGGSISNLQAGQTAGFRNAAVTATVASAAGAASTAVALDNVAAGSTLTFTGAALNTVSISGSVDQTGIAAGEYADLDISVDNDAAATNADVTTLNLAVSNNVDLAIAGPGAAELVTVDAAESTGGIRINLINVGADVLDLASVTLGSGNDTVLFNNVASDADEVTFDFGAGNDNIVVGLQATGDTDLSIVTGAGDDVITLQDGNINVNAGADGFDGSVTIADFAAASDALLVEGFDGFTAQNLVNTAVAGADSLYDAVQAVASIIGVGGTNVTDFAQFIFDGNTYLYGDVAAGGLDGDLLVGFTGVVDLNNDNVAQFVTA
ncbi:DUF4214 domain-containing protein [Devosia submarina]|uniref:DUF4214 domain-containing protein n=1 Tax=Devosia submarina TaxID=1173082 RepID=UPI000D383CB0|nr:DUF4214 domain-containing protein [Devosia submarina]